MKLFKKSKSKNKKSSKGKKVTGAVAREAIRKRTDRLKNKKLGDLVQGKLEDAVSVEQNGLYNSLFFRDGQGQKAIMKIENINSPDLQKELSADLRETVSNNKSTLHSLVLEGAANTSDTDLRKLANEMINSLNAEGNGPRLNMANVETTIGENGSKILVFRLNPSFDQLKRDLIEGSKKRKTNPAFQQVLQKLDELQTTADTQPQTIESLNNQLKIMAEIESLLPNANSTSIFNKNDRNKALDELAKQLDAIKENTDLQKDVLQEQNKNLLPQTDDNSPPIDRDLDEDPEKNTIRKTPNTISQEEALFIHERRRAERAAEANELQLQFKTEQELRVNKAKKEKEDAKERQVLQNEAKEEALKKKTELQEERVQKIENAKVDTIISTAQKETADSLVAAGQTQLTNFLGIATTTIDLARTAGIPIPVPDTQAILAQQFASQNQGLQNHKDQITKNVLQVQETHLNQQNQLNSNLVYLQQRQNQLQEELAKITSALENIQKSPKTQNPSESILQQELNNTSDLLKEQQERLNELIEKNKAFRDETDPSDLAGEIETTQREHEKIQKSLQSVIQQLEKETADIQQNLEISTRQMLPTNPFTPIIQNTVREQKKHVEKQTKAVAEIQKNQKLIEGLQGQQLQESLQDLKDQQEAFLADLERVKTDLEAQIKQGEKRVPLQQTLAKIKDQQERATFEQAGKAPLLQ